MSQPSVQGIASLFRGNPAPLQQRIQQEQQGKPGLPPDLHELMALNIVTNETDAVAKQQAMDQLAQMQGPQGKPPTVMDSVREPARQKMQAQALQAQQQQQAMQAMAQQAGPGPVPEGTQFAQVQPSAQGIDDLPVEFGLAGGGIVAFQKGGEGEYETPYDRMNRKNREEAETNRRFQERMSSTAYTRSVADMRNAGLNPAVMLNQGGGSSASTPGGSMARMESGNEAIIASGLEKARMQKEMAEQSSRIVKNLMETKKIEAETNAAKETKRLTSAQADRTEFENAPLSDKAKEASRLGFGKDDAWRERLPKWLQGVPMIGRVMQKFSNSAGSVGSQKNPTYTKGVKG